MPARPAAAARTARSRGESALDARLRRLLVRADRVERNRLAERLLPAVSHRRIQGGGGDGGAIAPSSSPSSFYWLRIADWLADAFGISAGDGDGELLDDLRWIQYCVFGLFRAQDDLVDGEADEPLIAVEANQLMVEAARRAARWFDGRSLFWEVFQETIDQTSRAIVALHDLQQTPEREPHVELGLYVDLAASLKIAAAGVTIAAGRDRDWRRRVSPALDRLAVAGQILDDVEDVDEDLAEGRINYAAWWLSRPVFGEGYEALRSVVAFNLATGDRLGGLLDVARSQVAAAEEVFGPELCPAVHRFLGLYRRRIDRIERQVERRRRSLFATARAAA